LSPAEISDDPPEIKLEAMGSRNGDDVSVVVYLLLTVAVFALLGAVLKLVEGA
jgi:hypothetical protein